MGLFNGFAHATDGNYDVLTAISAATGTLGITFKPYATAP